MFRGSHFCGAELPSLFQFLYNLPYFIWLFAQQPVITNEIIFAFFFSMIIIMIIVFQCIYVILWGIIHNFVFFQLPAI